jgi:PAS domain S-box-containing protein
MKLGQTTNFRDFAAQFFLGSIALALATLAFFRLHIDLASTAFAYLVMIVLFSLMGSFTASALLSIVAVAGLAYFFAPPMFNFWIDDPQHLVVVVAFLFSSLIVTRLIRNARKEKEAAFQAEARLRSSEADLRASETEWREVFEHNPVMYFMVDATGTVLNVNTFGAAQLGYSVTELAGQSVLNVFFEEDREFVRKCVAVCLETIGQSHTWEIRKVRKNGSVLWVRENAKAMRRADNQLIVLIACEDITERMQTENALRQSEAYLAQAQELSRTGSYGWNIATGEIIWSNETFRIFQCDQATKPTIKFVLQRTHPDDRAAVQRTIDQTSSDGKDFDHEYRLLLPDGSVKYVHAVARATRGASGSIEFVGAVTDVTAEYAAKEALKKALEEIKKSEDRLRLVIDTIPALVWRARPDGAADFFNQPYLDHTGLSLDQALEWGWTSAVHPDDVASLLESWRATWMSGTPREAEARLLRFDGEYRWFSFRNQPLRDEPGNITKWYGSATDIEDRKRTEVALRESEQRFRDYAETASDWLWETGPDHRITSISEHPNAAGILPSGLIGLARWDIAPGIEPDTEKWRKHRATLDAHLPFRDLVYRSVNRMGSPIYVRTSGKPFFDARGKFLGYRGVSTDITSAIRADQAEEALRRAQAELAHVTRVTTLGELTASIAHEINQPLAAVVANAAACLSWLDRETPDLAATRRSVEWIIEDGNRASEVIRHVRALAKKTDIEKVPLDVNDVVTEVTALVQRELVSQEVSLQVELAPTLLSIFGDRVQLQQVIINLVMNGIEAMQSVADRPRELVVRSGQDDMGRVLVTVKDCGVGICAEVAERMFNPFFTTKSGGMGMGLSICRSIVETHGGRLTASHNEGAGATFQVALPLHQEDAS